jgi:PAS domain S-box-containing protein
VIDDNLDFLKVVELLLVKEKFIVSTAHDGLGCMNAIRAEIPDVILLDVLLPDTTGNNICKIIKSSPEYSMIQIILISGIKNSSKDISAALALGAVDYIVKPVRNSELLKRIEIAIKFQKAEKALVESEKRFRLLYENAPLSYQSLSAEGNLIDVNPTWLSTLGYEREEVIGKYLGDFMTPESTEILKIRFPLVIKEGRIEQAEFEMKRKDGSSLFVSYDGKIGYDEFGNFKQIHCIFTDITDRKHAEAELKTSKDQLKKFTTHLLSIQEEEKILLATQLDNEMNQILFALKMDIGLLKKKVKSEKMNAETDDFIQKLDHAYDLVGISINSSMKFMGTLRNEVLYLVGFVDAVKSHTSDFQTKHNIITEFECNISTLNLNRQKSTSLFRIFENATSNVVQHSKASKMGVKLFLNGDKLTLQIWDNGIGIDPEKQSNPNSTGLIFMKERAHLLNGELQVESLKGEGTCVRVILPYQN